ncbi:MAG: adenylosuccinate synthetase [Candidatus Falkowbacteria bacterium]
MAAKQIYLVTDLGGGDGGKGGVIHKLCHHKHAHTVVKVGGAQGSHGVRTGSGQAFNFSQFGCGTFEGVRTHISKLMVIEPYALMHEAQKLMYEWGIRDIYDYLTIDRDALCITPFQTVASQLMELARKDKPKGTVGIGTGVTIQDEENYPELAIRAKDLASPDLKDRLLVLQTIKMRELTPIIDHVQELWTDDQDQARELIELLETPNLVDRIAESFAQLSKLAKIVDEQFMVDNILSRNGTIVVEGSNGVLTDRYYGFHPHTSSLRTVPDQTIKILDGLHYDGEIKKIGVTRAYTIRHGAGTMVTESPLLLGELLPGSSKNDNRWQGKVRVGPLDLVALRYAINACGGAQSFHALAITWLDQIMKAGSWSYCDSYNNATDPDYFSATGEIIVSHGSGTEQYIRQERLGQLLANCSPNLARLDGTTVQLMKNCPNVIQEKLNVTVGLTTVGPTEQECFIKI